MGLAERRSATVASAMHSGGGHREGFTALCAIVHHRLRRNGDDAGLGPEPIEFHQRRSRRRSERRRRHAGQGLRKLRLETTYDYTIFSAEVIPATDTVPEHCRVDGLIQPEIRFQVNLPTEWNGRFYMHGNGGYAGTQPNSPGRAAYRDAALAKGFGTAYTDTRHDSAVFPLGTFAYQDQAAEVDYT